MSRVPPSVYARELTSNATYRSHFVTERDWLEAMALAARLEAKGLHRRAWRIRWNLDGEQPLQAWGMPVDDDDDDAPAAKPARPPRPVKPREPVQLSRTSPAARMAKVRELVDKVRGRMAQQDLAVLLGVTATTVSRWVRGKTVPDDDVLARMEEVVNQEERPVTWREALGDDPRREGGQ